MTWSHDRAARRRDWLLYLLLIAAVLCLPQVISATGWFPEAGRLVWPVLWAALLGVALAHLGTGDLLAFVIALVLGLEYSAQFAGKVLPSLGLVIGDIVHYVSWAWDAAIRHLVAPLPFSEALAYTGEQLRTMVSNIWGWYALVRLGESSKDLTAMTIGVTWVAWILAWNAGYQLFRRRHAFAALLPLGAAIVANVAFTDIGIGYVHFYLAIVLLALVRSNVGRMEAIWSRLGLDFSVELKRDATVTGSFLALAIVVVGMITPYITYSRAVWAFWDRYGQTFLDFYDRLDRAFAGRNPVPEPTPGGPGGLAPHSVRTTGTLGEDVVLLVRTSDPPPPPPEELEMIGPDIMDPEALVPKRYWRERTYDTYTGSGWDSSQREEQSHAAGEPWGAIAYPHSVLTQTFELLAEDLPLAFGVNEPQYIAQPYRAVVRGEGDLAALLVEESQYQVVSHIPTATQEELQAAEEPYPAWVEERFLQLPEKLPQRIVDLAKQIVQEANAQTRYDKARAIERYIRSFDYDLELEPPPLSEDVVDYFLFQARRGYCDYSATAMTVMLRTVGVAARYASGFNMGHYDYQLKAWVVRQSNAHAWTEIYFPGYGWIEFEPTPTQRIFERASSYVSTSGPIPSLSTPQQRMKLPPLWLGAGILLFLVLFAVIWPPRWFKRRGREPRQLVLRTYGRLVRRARWAGLAPVGGQTPLEYLSALAREMERRAAFAAGVGKDIEIIGHVYQRARYSQQALSPDEGYRVESAWRRIRTKLTRLAFVGAPRGSAR